MAAFFISDIHLGLGNREQEKTKENRLLSFLHSILPRAEYLFIVGDLFDFWFEYATVIPKGFHRTLSALQEFTDRGTPVHYLAGNHDFWMGDYFQKELGFQVHADPFEIRIQDKRIYLHHGDGLAQKDLGYRLIKPILRNRWNIRLYRWLHPDLGVPIARGSSRTSREYTSNKDFGEEKGMVEFASKRIQEGVDIVVMGHRHRPSLLPIGTGVYINLGDWITFNSYGLLADGKMTLNSWEEEGQSNGR